MKNILSSLQSCFNFVWGRKVLAKTLLGIECSILFIKLLPDAQLKLPFPNNNGRLIGGLPSVR